MDHNVYTYTIFDAHHVPMSLNVNETILQLTTPVVSIEHSDKLKQEGWLNARAAEQNSPANFVEYWIVVQAHIDTDGVVKSKTPSAIG